MAHYPLSRGQERLWFEDRLEPGMATYNISYCFHLEGPLNIEALRKSVRTVIDRHEVLRSIFRELDDQLVQVVQDYHPESFSLIDCTSMQETERSGLALQAAIREARTPFDLCTGPLFRARVQQLSSSEHLLSVTLHHAVTDGWSMTVFFRELSEAYRAHSTGQEPSLPVVPIQFGDYARNEKGSTSDASMAQNLAYWQRQLGGALSPLDMPTDRARPAVRRSVGGRFHASIDPVLLGKIRSVSSKNGVTPFMLLLAAFKALLYRYTGQENIIVGTPVAGRKALELFDAIGFFVNTIVLRTSLEGNPTFLELLKRVRETTLNAVDHEDTPFEELVRVLQVRRDRSRTPLYQVMFVQDPTGGRLDLSGISVRKVDVDNGGAKCDLTLFVNESADGAQTEVEYSTDLFDEATIRRMLNHYIRLLEGIAENPGCRLNQLPVLTEPERSQLLVDWCATAREYPRDRSVPSLFEEEVERNGQHTALICGDVQVTYSDLNRRANRLAHRLRREGVGQETPVALCLERSIDMVVGMLGILKAGGTYIPIDPEYPHERLRYILQDANVRVVLTNSRLSSRFAADQVRLLCCDLEEDSIAEESGRNPGLETGPAGCAYIMYTSGTTGKPKGVCVPHRGIVRLVRGNSYASFGPDEVFLQLAPYAFDASTFEIWGSLLNGGRLVIPPPDPPTFEDLGRIITETHVSTLWLTAGLFHNIVDTNLESLAGLRQLLVGGDVVSPSHTAKFKARYPGCRLINGYGPTENTTFTCCYEISGNETGALPLGRPIANTIVYILDPDLRPVPVGVVGELCIAGDGLALGYAGDEKITAQKFVPNPFGTPNAPTLYRSGDRARYRSDGVILFEGRVDDQVKISGYRIEPKEIEAVLASCPGLAQVFVQARPFPNGEKRLVAYYIPADGAKVSGLALQAFLQEKLPKYMIPSSFVALREFPLNAQGKVDRRALPEPQATDGAGGKDQTLPRDQVEEMLASIWRKLFGVEYVGVRDNFFELGGHSLMALRFFAALKKSTGIELPLAVLFKAPTIEQLAAVVREKGWRPVSSCLVPMKPDGTQPPIYFIHSVGGAVLNYYALAHLLSGDQPVYGIQPVGLDGKEEPLARVDDMVVRYIREIQTVQPSGPYYLSGYSLGGILAFEMARKLTASGEKVAFLALLDTFSLRHLPNWWQVVRNKSRRMNTKTRHRIQSLVSQPPRTRIDHIRQSARRFAQRIGRRAWELTIGRKESEKALMTDPLRKVRKGNELAVDHYRSVPHDGVAYPGDITLFLAEGRAVEGPVNPAEEWRSMITGEIRVITVPGDHGTMLREPNVKVLGQRFKECLAAICRPAEVE